MVRDLLQLNTFHKKAIVALVGVFCTLIVTYGLLVRQTVANVVARRVVEQSITQSATDVALLEARYMAAADQLTLSRAAEMGFVETDVTLFVSRRADTFSVRGTE